MKIKTEIKKKKEKNKSTLGPLSPLVLAMPPLPSAEWVSWSAQHRTSIPHPPGWFHMRPRGTHVQPLRARAYGRETPIEGLFGYFQSI